MPTRSLKNALVNGLETEQKDIVNFKVTKLKNLENRTLSSST